MWDFNKFLHEIDFLGDLLNKRIDSLKAELDFKPLIRQLDHNLALETALEYFGEGDYKVLGIDGSMVHKERLEIIILYIAIAGFTAPISIRKNHVAIDLKNVSREDKYVLSAIIPLWLEDITDVLKLHEIGLSRSLDAAIEGIPFSIMTFGEFYLGYKAVKEDEPVRIILFDRPFASTIHPYQRDLRKLIFDGDGGVFTKVEIDGIRLSKADLLLGLYLGPNVYKLPFRKPYKLYSIIQEIILNGGESRYSELEKKFKVSRDKIIKHLKRLDEEYLNNTLVDEYTYDGIVLNKDVLNYWDKIKHLVEVVGLNIFKMPITRHPLYLGNDIWIGTKELNSITLFMIYDMIKEALNRNKLLVGIGKDTYVTDITRSILPYLRSRGVLNYDSISIKSDRPLLTILSSLDNEVFKTPWRFIGYDGAFATLTKNENPPPILRASRKYVFHDGLLIRSYFQLRSFKSIGEVLVKSPVFFYDRFIDKRYDKDFRSIEVLSGYGNITINPYLETGFNKLDNLILFLLSLMDNPEVAEATGHNYLLFLADKDVKAAINLVKEGVIDMTDLKVNEVIKKRRLFIITRKFRDFRHLVERRRRR